MAPCEHEFLHHGVQVQYKRRAARLDRRHLIVMFTGLRPLDAYDFDGRSSRDSQANWLWIKDSFDGYYAYSVCRNMDFGVERAVLALIDAELARLGLTRNECTLAGISKGGFPALYFGIKYNFRNIVANAPQIYVGTHTRKVRPGIFAHMTGGGGDREQRLLDALLPDAVAADRGMDKNIYIFSSRRDQFHDVQIAPALPLFAKYPNFNYIETDSDLVWDHAGTIRYNLPLVLSVLYAAADNAPPRLGTVRNGHRQAPGVRRKALERQRAAGGSVANLSSGRLEGGRFFPEGAAFLRGHAVGKASALDTTLVLWGNGTRHEFPLAGDRTDPSVSFRYYQEAACNYNRARFTSPDKPGIDLSELPAGSYGLLLRLATDGREVEVPLRSAEPIRAESHLDGRLYRLRSGEGRALLDVRPAVGRAPG
ncbi:accessory Sec system protein Asp2, partial [Arthrobacter sp. GCM10027362]|uniref:accessory Sec system protein Asp2 n=1 Tax=Arthrobacter sp. GCM10027362 TaxID=3273379 RepID=UPI003625D166